MEGTFTGKTQQLYYGWRSSCRVRHTETAWKQWQSAV